MKSLAQEQKELLDCGDELYRPDPDTEVAIHNAINAIVLEAIAGAPKRQRLERARAALATSSQYLRQTIVKPEFVPADMVDRAIGKKFPVITKGEFADVLLSAAGVLFPAVLGKSAAPVDVLPSSEPVSPEVAKRYRDGLKALAETISKERLDPRGIDMGSVLRNEIGPLQVVTQFVQQRVDVVRDGAHPTSNSMSGDISVRRRCATRAERLILPRLAEGIGFWAEGQPDPEEVEDAIADTIAELCHLADVHGLDVDDLLARGRSYYQSERREGPGVYSRLKTAQPQLNGERPGTAGAV